MDSIQKIKLSIYESHDAGVIDEETMTEMVSVCESADMDNEEDREKVSEVVDKLIAATEASKEEDEECEGEDCEKKKKKSKKDDEEDENEEDEEDEVKESVTEKSSATSIKLAIYESADKGDITEDEKEILLSIMG